LYIANYSAANANPRVRAKPHPTVRQDGSAGIRQRSGSVNVMASGKKIARSSNCAVLSDLYHFTGGEEAVLANETTLSDDDAQVCSLVVTMKMGTAFNRRKSTHTHVIPTFSCRAL